MPEPLFFCHSCKKMFRKVMVSSQGEEGEIVCPHCGSDDIEESRLAFYERTSRKSA